MNNIKPVPQLSQEQATSIFESKEWESWSAEEIVRFQLFQTRLCIPFRKFHESVEAVLGRPVYTHEFAYPDNLINEYIGKKESPTLKEIIELIPGIK